jgi:hypothetical protein
MITYLIVTLIVTAVIVSMHFMKPTKKHRLTSLLDEVNENPAFQDMKGLFDIMQQMNEDGTDEDVIPEGYGEFGYDLTNPIPVNSTIGITSYFAKLKTMDNAKVSNERIGSFNSPVSKHPVDGYKISFNGKELTTLYISCYHKRNSEKAPKHFKF